MICDASTLNGPTITIQTLLRTETWSLKTSTNLPNYLLRERIPIKRGDAMLDISVDLVRLTAQKGGHFDPLLF